MESGWQPDPSGRHQERWYDGTAWGTQVRDHGVVNEDAAGVPGGASTGSAAGPPPSRRAASGGARFGVIGPSSDRPPPPASPITGPSPHVAGGPAAPVSAGSVASEEEEPLVPVVHRETAGPGPSPTAARPPSSAPVGPGGIAAPGQGGLAVLGANSIITGLLAGGIGSFVGVIVAEVLKSPGSINPFRSAAQIRFDSGVWVAIIGAILGATLASWESLTAMAWNRAPRDAAIGGVTGAIAGFAGGYIAQWLFTSMLESLTFDATQSDVENRLLLARAVGWGLFGTVLGCGLGIPGGARKAVNGFIGGAIGGVLGGIAFEMVARSAEAGDDTAMLRIVGMGVTGVGIGLAIGLVDRITRQAWVRFSSGPLRGREVILFKPRTTVGGSAACDIVLANDPTVSALHATVVHGPSGVTIEATGPVEVAGVAVTGSQAVRPGQVVQIGRSELTVGTRAVR